MTTLDEKHPVTKSGTQCKYDELISLAELCDEDLNEDKAANIDAAMERVIRLGSAKDKADAMRLYVGCLLDMDFMNGSQA